MFRKFGAKKLKLLTDKIIKNYLVDIQTKEQVVERKSKKLMKGLQYFEENLGLNIKRFPGIYSLYNYFVLYTF